MTPPLEAEVIEGNEEGVESESETPWLVAVRAAESKKATEIKVLDLTGVTSFTDFFVICTGANTKQLQAIADEVCFQLKKLGTLPLSVEGSGGSEWVLCDFGDFIVHVFSTEARAYYGLERLWTQGKEITPPPA